MPTIVTKRVLNPTVTLMEVDCPAIARKAKPGQFVMVRSDPMGERIPLTIADYDAVRGTVTIMYQRVGLTTQKLDQLNSGDDILDMVGPLGNPTEVDGVKRAGVIGGGVGCAIAFPQAKALYRAGAHVDVIVGFRTKELVFLEVSFRKNCTNLYITTDDGTYGEKGFVSNKLDELLSEGHQYDVAIAIGPVPMMRAISQVTLPYHLKTLVSLNPLMACAAAAGCAWAARPSLPAWTARTSTATKWTMTSSSCAMASTATRRTLPRRPTPAICRKWPTQLRRLRKEAERNG